jgi:hypothetical protein
VSAQFKLTVFPYEALCFFNNFYFVQIAGQQDRLREQGDALAAQAQALAMLQGHVAKLEESIANSSRGQRQAADTSSNQQLSSLPRLRELRSAATSPLPPLPSSPRPSPTRTAAQQVLLCFFTFAHHLLDMAANPAAIPTSLGEDGTLFFMSGCQGRASCTNAWATLSTDVDVCTALPHLLLLVCIVSSLLFLPPARSTLAPPHLLHLHAVITPAGLSLC